MLFVITAYNRPKMLRSVINEILSHDSINNEILIIDDGSQWSKSDQYLLGLDRNAPVQFVRLSHGGKTRFWKNWLIAHEIALGSNHNQFVFLPDDITEIDFNTIEALSIQPWQSQCFCFNLSNEGQRYRWEVWDSGQPDIEINGITFMECGYVDGLFYTNRRTLELMEFDRIPSDWFDRDEKSSGVGFYLSMLLRTKGVKMMLPDSSIALHGGHESQMHKEHRKTTPLISIRK